MSSIFVAKVNLQALLVDDRLAMIDLELVLESRILAFYVEF